MSSNIPLISTPLFQKSQHLPTHKAHVSRLGEVLKCGVFRISSPHAPFWDEARRGHERRLIHAGLRGRLPI